MHNTLDILGSDIAAGNAPDIVGPLGMASLSRFTDVWLDLNPLIKGTHTDVSSIAPGILRLLQQDSSGTAAAAPAQVGLPFTEDPSFLFYNKELFKKAGLPDPPQVVGEPYMGQAWDWKELASIAAELTLDSSGRNATQAGFDPAKIVQYGLDFPAAAPRMMASTFGGGSFDLTPVSGGGWTTQIPPPWTDAFNWYYAAMWKSHIAPTMAAQSSDLLGSGNSIASGHVAMAVTRLSAMSTFSGLGTAAAGRWGLAVIPSWKGATTSPTSVGTFTIPTASRFPNQAFKLMLAIESNSALLDADGDMPASGAAAQNSWLDSKGLHGVDQALLAMEMLPAVPTPEQAIPSCHTFAEEDSNSFFAKLRSTPNLDVAAELRTLQESLLNDMTMTCPLS
jgi:multiple sugar transport system substrate-binding protein